MLVVKKLGDIERYNVSVDDLFDNRPPSSMTIDTKKSNQRIAEEYYYGCDYMMHEHNKHHPPFPHPHHHECDCFKQPPIPHYPPEDHRDHYIEPQHHAEGEKHHRPPCKPHKKPDVHKPGSYYKEHPRREIRPLEPFECPFPKQEVMLLDIDAYIKRSIVINFKYNTCTVTKEISEGDIIHAYYIEQGNSENQLTEITGKVTYIDFNNMKLYIDYSVQYEAFKVDIYINTLRFISTDLYEIAPFFEQEEVYEEPLIEEPIDILPPPDINEIDPDYDVDSNLDYDIDSSLFIDKDDEDDDTTLPTEEVKPTKPGEESKDDESEDTSEEGDKKDDTEESETQP